MALDARFETHDRVAPDFRGLSRDVASDFDRIFRRAETARTEPPSADAVRTVARQGPERRAGAAAAIGAAVAAALGGLALGVVLTQRNPPRHVPVAAPLATTASPPVAAAPPPQVVTPPAVQAPAAQAPDAQPPLASVVREPPAVTPPQLRRAETTVAPRPTRAKPGSRAWRDPCGQYRGAALARCAYPSVIAADRRLRAAYARASRAGVARATLSRVRSDWASLRHRTNSQPQMVIGRYNRMTAELNRLSARRGSR